MPKVSRTKKSHERATKALSKPTTSTKNKNNDVESTKTAAGKPKEETLSRGQRKRQAKREQYLKRENMILSTLHLKKLEDQKGKLDGMDAIKDALTSAMQQSQQKAAVESSSSQVAPAAAPMVKTNKEKKDLAQREITHMNLVLQHPSFKENPFATMQEHLKNTLAKNVNSQEAKAEEERKVEEKKVMEKKELKKERIREMKYQRGRRGSRFRRRE